MGPQGEVSGEQRMAEAREHFAAQDYFGAVHLLEELIATGRAFADAHHLLGLSLHLLDQPERALAALDQALALNPRYVEAQLHRALVLDALGRSREAAEALARARELGGEVRQGIPATHAAKLANLHAELAEAYAETGVLERAVEEYRRALELGPAFHDLRYRLARRLLDAGRPREAREELERVVEARPQFFDAWASLGLAAYVAGDAGTARAVWTRLAGERPRDARVRAYLSLLDRAAGRASAAALTLALLACGGAAADHETLGDRAYLNRQFQDAFVEYRLALRQRSDQPRVHAKAGAAALRVGDLTAAAAEYLALGRAAAERRGEAADGLERVARAALSAGDRPALAAALNGLRQIAAGRALGAFAGQMASGLSEANPQEAIAMLPYAAAAASDARAQDSLMLQYGRALARGGQCAEAAPVFEALIRRNREPGVARGGLQGFLQCAVSLGQAALERDATDEAEGWFRRAAHDPPEHPLARAAQLGLGDILRARNDLFGAAAAYQRALQGAPPGDSVGDLARARLGEISNAGTGGW